MTVMGKTYDDIHALTYRMHVGEAGRSDEQDIDISGLLRHNSKYAKEYAAKHNVRRFYLDDVESYGGIINGEKLIVDFHKRHNSREAEDKARSSMHTAIFPAFALSYALDCEQPDAVIAVMHGAIGFAATSEYFGYPAKLIEAHRKGSIEHEKPLGAPPRANEICRELTPMNLKPTDKVLILEDTSDGLEERTYRVVQNHLQNEYGLPKENMRLFFGRPGHGFNTICNPYFNNQTEEEIAEATANFGAFLKEGPYFLNYPDFIGDVKTARAREQDWQIFKQLATRNDFATAMKRLEERLQGKHY